MITNFRTNLRYQINSNIDDKINNYPKNIPCKVDSINEDYTVNVISLVDDILYNNIQVFYPQGICFNPELLTNGLLINSYYWFNSLRETGEVKSNVSSSLTQFGIFVPLIDKQLLDKYDESKIKDSDLCLHNSDFKNRIDLTKDTCKINSNDKSIIELSDSSINLDYDKKSSITMDSTISMKSNQDNITMDNGIVINSSSPMEIKTNTSSLYEVLNDILNMLTKMNLDPVAGNGASLASPTLTAELPTIITKLNGVLK